MILLAELAYVLLSGSSSPNAGKAIDPKQVSTTLYGPYLLGVELASLLLLAGLVGAYHLGRRDQTEEQDALLPRNAPSAGSGAQTGLTGVPK